MRSWVLAVAVVLLTLAGASASAQPMPDTLRSAGVSQAQWDAIRREARTQAQRAQISEASLLAAAQASGANLANSGRFDALGLQQTILETLAEQADQIAELQRRLDALTGDADPAVARIFAEARAALEEGRFDEADQLLAQVAESDLAAIQQADAEVERLRLRAGETIASRGQIASVQADYLRAADHYERAAETAPQTAIEARNIYSMYRRFALAIHRDQGALQRRVAELEALALSIRETDFSEWGRTQMTLGILHTQLAENGTTASFERAVAAFESALEVRTRAADPFSWAQTHYYLALAYHNVGRRRDAHTAARSALDGAEQVGEPVFIEQARSLLGQLPAE